jgi:hypothetical protein
MVLWVLCPRCMEVDPFVLCHLWCYGLSILGAWWLRCLEVRDNASTEFRSRYTVNAAGRLSITIGISVGFGLVICHVILFCTNLWNSWCIIR